MLFLVLRRCLVKAPVWKIWEENLYLEFEAQNLQKVCSHDFQSIAGHFRHQTDFSTPSEGISEPRSEFSENPLPKS